MKTQLNFKRRIPFLGLLAVMAGMVFFSQCKDDEITALNEEDVTGEYAVNTTDASWRLDKSHSAINWQTAYVEDQAYLTGKFNTFSIAVNFDEKNLATSSISSWVLLSACNTGEPGRDGLGKCLNGYLGVEHNGDTLSNGSLDPKGIVGSSDTARFTSTKIERYGNGFVATGNLAFHGATKEVQMYFTYNTMKDLSDPPDGSKLRASFEGHFDFNAKSDYGVVSTSIADKVSVTINCNLRND